MNTPSFTTETTMGSAMLVVILQGQHFVVRFAILYYILDAFHFQLQFFTNAMCIFFHSQIMMITVI
ncbi:hypothetical protein Golax_009714 [Gossypium laxum]|uniref:Uncharacterized protein n=1 Tax=Gossypium laxum TaxID=34288 RepID=A0A7J8ZF81_9ROSI|nr:hypothetical protein [Gossypium laxum]